MIKLELNEHIVANILTIFHNKNDMRSFKQVTYSILNLPNNWQEDEWLSNLEAVIRNHWGDVNNTCKSLELMHKWCHKLDIKRTIFTGLYPSTERHLQIKLHALYAASVMFAIDEDKETIKAEFFQLIQENKIKSINQLLQEEKGEE